MHTIAVSTYGSHRVSHPTTKQKVSAYKLGYTGAARAVLLALLRAMERPRIVFQARAVAAAMAATVGVALIYKFAVTGAIAASQLALGTETIFMMVAAWSIWQHARPGGPPQIAHAGDGGPRHLREPSTDSGMSADSALHPTLAVPPDDRS